MIQHKILENIPLRFSTSFVEKRIDISIDDITWQYTLDFLNSTDTLLRVTEVLFYTINEFKYDSPNTFSEPISGFECIVPNNSYFSHSGVILVHSHSVISYGFVKGFNELDEDFQILIPTFSLDSPYTFMMKH